jgi:hypothetical protein
LDQQFAEFMGRALGEGKDPPEKIQRVSQGNYIIGTSKVQIRNVNGQLVGMFVLLLLFVSCYCFRCCFVVG